VVPGVGTALNVATVLAGSAIGVLLRGRLPERPRGVVTDGLGLGTLMIAAINASAISDPSLVREVGRGATVLVVLGAVVIGGVAGSLLRIEGRLESLGGRLQRRPAPPGSGSRAPFVEGYVAASLVFCVGPLTILGSLSDGLGRGIDQLVLKSTLDGFASIAFAASFGWGVAASAFTVAVVQGGLTLLGVLLGGLLPGALVAAVTATGRIVAGRRGAAVAGRQTGPRRRPAASVAGRAGPGRDGRRAALTGSGWVDSLCFRQARVAE